MQSKIDELEKEVQAHRYLYLLEKPILSNPEYDMMLRTARVFVDEASVIHYPMPQKLGDYPSNIKLLALTLLEEQIDE